MVRHHTVTSLGSRRGHGRRDAPLQRRRASASVACAGGTRPGRAAACHMVTPATSWCKPRPLWTASSRSLMPRGLIATDGQRRMASAPLHMSGTQVWTAASRHLDFPPPRYGDITNKHTHTHASLASLAEPLRPSHGSRQCHPRRSPDASAIRSAGQLLTDGERPRPVIGRPPSHSHAVVTVRATSWPIVARPCGRRNRLA